MRRARATLMEREVRRLFRSLVGQFLLSVVSLTACGGNTPAGSSAGGAAGSGDAASSAGSGGQEAGSPGGSGGTGGGGSAEPFWPDLPIDQFTRPVCDGTSWNAAAGLNPAQPVDHVEVNLSSSSLAAGNRFEEGTSGTPCLTASDANACQAAVEAARASIVHTQSCSSPPSTCQYYLLTTRGDSVAVYLPGAGYLEFLGVIDTPQEARLVVHGPAFNAGSVRCDDDNFLVREVPGAYQVVVNDTTGDCGPLVVERVLVNVARDGAITELRRKCIR